MSSKDRVIVIGGGPVGLVAAVNLARAGIPVLVLDEASEPFAEPRASTFHPPTLDMLDELGLGARMVALGRPSPTWQYCVFETGERAIFDLGVLRDETNHPYRLQCEQINLVIEAGKLLQEEAPGSLIYNARAIAVSQDENGVTVTAKIGGEIQQLQAAWLIGADGASSIVRKSLALPFGGETYPLASVSVGTTFPFHDNIEDLCGVNYFWADGWEFSMFQTKIMWRVGFSPPQGMDDDAAVAPQEINARLSRIVPTTQHFDIIAARVYRVHRRLVDRLRVGRILLAGDAAHLNTPSGGFGMNGGVHDAFNLSDKLARVWHGENESLLDLYSRQRHYAAQSDIQKTSDENYKRHREKDPKRRRAALKQMQDVASDKDKMYAFLRATSLMDSLDRANRIE